MCVTDYTGVISYILDIAKPYLEINNPQVWWVMFNSAIYQPLLYESKWSAQIVTSRIFYRILVAVESANIVRKG